MKDNGGKEYEEKQKINSVHPFYEISLSGLRTEWKGEGKGKCREKGLKWIKGNVKERKSGRKSGRKAKAKWKESEEKVEGK